MWVCLSPRCSPAANQEFRDHSRHYVILRGGAGQSCNDFSPNPFIQSLLFSSIAEELRGGKKRSLAPGDGCYKRRSHARMSRSASQEGKSCGAGLRGVEEPPWLLFTCQIPSCSQENLCAAKGDVISSPSPEIQLVAECGSGLVLLTVPFDTSCALISFFIFYYFNFFFILFFIFQPLFFLLLLHSDQAPETQID